MTRLLPGLIPLGDVLSSAVFFFRSHGPVVGSCAWSLQDLGYWRRWHHYQDWPETLAWRFCFWNIYGTFKKKTSKGGGLCFFFFSGTEMGTFELPRLLGGVRDNTWQYHPILQSRDVLNRTGTGEIRFGVSWWCHLKLFRQKISEVWPLVNISNQP